MENKRSSLPRLGVNIDHIATLRQLRGTPYPSVPGAAETAIDAGARQITIHLREDRRHIQDQDVVDVLKVTRKKGIPLNLEMAVAEPIVRIALKTRPEWACLVPEKRQEVTTEGGLDLKAQKRRLENVIPRLKRAGIRVSLFIEPSLDAVQRAHALGADAIELHTGLYCRLTQTRKPNQARIRKEITRIAAAARLGRELGLSVHAGHGLDDRNVRPLAALVTRGDKEESGEELIVEYNIGHWIVARAAMVGLHRAVREMLSAMTAP
jgi:pyridoxine 5-phosphate synthase